MWLDRKTGRIDLTNRSVKVEDLDPKLAEEYLGARGLGTRSYATRLNLE